MKKLFKTTIVFLSLLIACTFFSFASYAAESSEESEPEVVIQGDCSAEGSKVSYVLYDTGLLVISGSGAMADYTLHIPEWSNYKSSITEIQIWEGVAAAGAYAFSECGNVTTIKMPNSLQYINEGAFGCCTSLESISLPKNLSHIWQNAFVDCTSLKEICIPASVAGVETGAFAGCSALESITVDKDNITYLSKNNCLIEGASGTLLAGCKNSVIPTDGSVKKLDKYAFARCLGLKSIHIPASVSNIGNYVFEGCSDLESIIVDQNNTVYHSSGNCLIETGSKTLLAGCKNSVIPTDGSVQSLTAGSFGDCTGLKSIYIPASVTDIGVRAFGGCSGVESIHVNQDNPVYHNSGNCLIQTASKKLILGCKNSDIPDDGSVLAIDGSAFSGCSELKAITIPKHIESIGLFAFSECSSLESVIILNDDISIANIVFGPNTNPNLTIYCNAGSAAKRYALERRIEQNELPFFGWDVSGDVLTVAYVGGEMPNYTEDTAPWKDYKDTVKKVVVKEGTTSIGNYAFYGFTKVTSYSLPSTLKSIGNYAMASNETLASITLPEGLQSIGECAFYLCSLKSIVIPDSVTKIGAAAFRRNDWTLESAKLPADFKTIPYSLFQECYKLTDVTFPENLETIQSNAFLFCRFTELNLPSTVKYIGEHAFRKARIKNLKLPDGVSYIGYTAFSQNPNLETASIPASLEAIPSELFYDCPNLTTVSIPEGVTSIGANAFDQCPKITGLTLPAGITQIGANAFSGITSTITFKGSRLNWLLLTENVSCGSDNITFAGTAATAIESADCGSIVVKKPPIKEDSKYTVQYAINKKNSAPTGNWQDSPVFTDFDKNTKYYAFYKVTENGELVDSMPAGAEVKTVDHTWNAGVVETPASLSKDGLRTYTCTVCKASKKVKTAKIKMVSATKTSLVYTGKAQNITVKVTDSSGKTVSNKYYTVSYSNNKNIGTAKAVVKFTGLYSGTKTLSFKIVPKATTISKVKSSKKGTATVSVKKQSVQTTGYEIQYSTSSKFTGSTSKTVKISSAKVLSKTISKLKSAKTYYFRVRTYKTVSKVNYVSAWSKSVKAKIK